MDPRIALLQAFYSGLPKDRAKVETYEHGFAFLETLLSDGVTLEYGELTLTGFLHKYKLGNLPVHRLDELLVAHVAKRCNVCLYFDGAANNVLCFNLDNNHKTDNTVLIPEMEFAVRFIREQLVRLECPPLIVASGRGYHVWCRFESAIENNRLYDFMLRVAVRTMAALHGNGHDYRRIKINVYPDRRTSDVVSLRLFGSDHAKNKVFSRVLAPDRLLDEDESWAAFAHHLAHRLVPLPNFEAACRALAENGGEKNWPDAWRPTAPHVEEAGNAAGSATGP